MPIQIPNDLPAAETLKQENIFVMKQTRAETQHIRPLEIVLLNLMPTKIVTETQLSRVLGNTPLQVHLELMMVSGHKSKNTSQEHLLSFYKTFEELKDRKFDGMVITGAPVEHLEFEDVDYWQELCEIMEWSKTHVHSTFHICWAAQAGLYYHYGIGKYELPKKISGIYKHKVKRPTAKLMSGFDQEFYAPHSRYTEIHKEDIKTVSELAILASSKEVGPYIVVSKDGKHVFVTGHSEYDADTLHNEYIRDLDKGINPDIPANYYPGDDPTQKPIVKWRAHSNLLFTNWLNYYVYQITPYNIGDIG